MKKVSFAVIWGIVFFVITSILVGAFTGLVFQLLDAIELEIQTERVFMYFVGACWMFVPMIGGATGIVLGMQGKLPGTGSPQVE